MGDTIREAYQCTFKRSPGWQKFQPERSEGEGLTRFVKDRKIDYPVILDCAAINDDYHVSLYPTMYLIGKDGKILYSGTGFSEENAAAIIQLLGWSPDWPPPL